MGTYGGTNQSSNLGDTNNNGTYDFSSGAGID